MTVLSIDHVQLAMPAGGEERAAAFYEALLGIPRAGGARHLGGAGRRGERVRLGVALAVCGHQFGVDGE